MMKMVGVVGGLMDQLPDERLKTSRIVILDAWVTTYPAPCSDLFRNK